MKRIRQGWNTLRRSRRSGVSLIVALCAVAVLIGLSLSIVYSSSMLLSRANRKIGRERCYQLAQSFAQVLDSELQEYKTIKPELDTNFAPEGCFYREVNNILAEDTGLGIYDPDRSDETTACYNAGSTEDNYGRITILLRDVTDVQDPITGDTFEYDARNEGTEKAEQTTFNRHQVWVGVKAEKGADSYMYTTEYRRKDSFQPIYTWEGEDGVQFPVYWVNGRMWRSATPMISTIQRTADTNPSTSRQPGQPEVQPMNRLIRVLRDRRGESMVEILVSTVVFMLLLGALNGAVGFASNAQRKSEQLRRDATELQESVRGNAEVADGEAAAYDFKVTTSNGEDTDIDAFRIKVKKQTVNAKTEDGKTVPFYRFAKGE